MKARLLIWLGEKQLLRAAERGDTSRLRTLIGRGANPSVTDPIGRTALHYATTQGQVEAVRTLLLYGAEPNVRDNGLGYTPLNLAVREGQAEIAELLLKHGADVRGLHDRLLERAMRNQDTPIALLLRQYGARMAHEPEESSESRVKGPLPASKEPAAWKEEEAGPEEEAAPRSPERIADRAAPPSKRVSNRAASRGEPDRGEGGTGVAERRNGRARQDKPRRSESDHERATANGETEAAAAETADPELAAVVRAWPGLSQPMRAAILSMIEANSVRGSGASPRS